MEGERVWILVALFIIISVVVWVCIDLIDAISMVQIPAHVIRPGSRHGMLVIQYDYKSVRREVLYDGWLR